MAKGGITDKIQMLEESAYGDGGTDGEIIFGNTISFEWNAETNSDQSYGLEDSGPGATKNKDGVLIVSGSHEWEVTDGREFAAILGSITDGGTGSFSLSTSNDLPSYAAKVVDDESNYLLISGIKYRRFSLSFERENTIRVTAEWEAQNIEDTTSFTPTVSSVEPLTYLDGKFSIDSTDKTGVENIALEIERDNKPRRFIEDYDTGERRLISTILNGPLSITFSGTMEASRDLLEELWGGTSLTDTRSDKSFGFVASRGDTTLNLSVSGGRLNSNGRTFEKTAEMSAQDFEGVGLDVTGTGSYPN